MRLLLLGRAQRKIDGMRLVCVDWDAFIPLAVDFRKGRPMSVRTTRGHVHRIRLVAVNHRHQMIFHVFILVGCACNRRPETHRMPMRTWTVLGAYSEILERLFLGRLFVSKFLAESLGHIRCDFVEFLAAVGECQFPAESLFVLPDREMHIRKLLVFSIKGEPRTLSAKIRLRKTRFGKVIPIRSRCARLWILADVFVRLDGFPKRLRVFGRPNLKVERRAYDYLSVLNSKLVSGRKTTAHSPHYRRKKQFEISHVRFFLILSLLGNIIPHISHSHHNNHGESTPSITLASRLGLRPREICGKMISGHASTIHRAAQGGAISG